MAKVETYTFINSQLDADFNITWEHGKNTSNVVAMWVDNTGIVRNTTDVIQIVDDNNVLVSCGGTITGDNTIILFYDDTSTFTGRKLFELVDITNYQDILSTLKVAVGKTDTPSQNVPFSVLVEYFQHNLDVLRKSAALSDIPASELVNARASLQVLSIAQITALLAAKAGVYGGGSGFALSVTNTADFTPTQNFHPATKAYVDSLAKGVSININMGNKSTYIDSSNIVISNCNLTFTRVDKLIYITGSIGGTIFLPNNAARIYFKTPALPSPPASGVSQALAACNSAVNIDTPRPLGANIRFTGAGLFVINSSLYAGDISGNLQLNLNGVYLTD